MKRDPIAWLSRNGHDVVRLTGQDVAAVRAAAALWDLYAVSDRDGQRAAILAAGALHDSAMQESTRHLIVKIIPFALDWADEKRIGPLVAGS